MRTIHLIFFSPTRTTRTTLEAIAAGTGCTPGSVLDLTRAVPPGRPEFGTGDLVLIGMPVYAGRLPALAVERFQKIKGGGAVAAPIVVYGNRHYDDALIELYDLCREQHFRPIAAGAFLGEHSFSTTTLPLSAGRPDAADLEQAAQFGRRLRHAEQRLEKVPGNRPYKDLMQPSGSATSVNPAACSRCGICIAICPTGGMHLTETAAEADPNHCIWCMACERYCPENARSLTHEKVMASAQKLDQLFSERREPELFFST
ncbi:ferredoxin family protein [Pontiellaceae bacterium B12227]|nr:ferredoxin family protein [Pontiellaceae bacterium B12227]